MTLGKKPFSRFRREIQVVNLEDFDSVLKNQGLILEQYAFITRRALIEPEISLESLQALEREREQLVHLIQHNQSRIDKAKLSEIADSERIIKIRSISAHLDEIRSLDELLVQKTNELSYRILREMNAQQAREDYGKGQGTWKR